MSCLFCGQDGDVVCDSPKCQEYDRELREEMREQYRKDVRAGVKSALKQRCKCESDWAMTRFTRWLYVLKLLICVALRLTYKGKEMYPDCIAAGCFREHRDGYGWSADWIRVGRGVWSGWWFDLEHDGDSFM